MSRRRVVPEPLRKEPRRALVLVAAIALAGCNHWKTMDPTLARMVEQRRADPFAPSDVFADGAAMRAPPIATVAIEDDLDPLSAHGIDGAAYATRPPMPITRPLLERGRDRFAIFCAPCHGVSGDGHGPVGERMTLVHPRDLHLPTVRAQPIGRLFRTVTEGFGLMPGYATQLTVEDRWAVVAYLRALQLSQHAEVDALPADVRDEARARLDGGAR